MKNSRTKLITQHGMTLVEVLVTLSILSFVLASIFSLYSSMLPNIQRRDSTVNLLQETDMVMAMIGKDIQTADEFLENYPSSTNQTVVAAIKTSTNPSTQNEGRVIVYTLDPTYPTRLLRSVYAGEKSTTTEISRHVRKMSVLADTPKLVKVDLLLEDTVAGELRAWHTSSAFALRN